MEEHGIYNGCSKLSGIRRNNGQSPLTQLGLLIISKYYYHCSYNYKGNRTLLVQAAPFISLLLVFFLYLVFAFNFKAQLSWLLSIVSLGKTHVMFLLCNGIVGILVSFSSSSPSSSSSSSSDQNTNSGDENGRIDDYVEQRRGTDHMNNREEVEVEQVQIKIKEKEKEEENKKAAKDLFILSPEPDPEPELEDDPYLTNQEEEGEEEEDLEMRIEEEELSANEFNQKCEDFIRMMHSQF